MKDKESIKNWRKAWKYFGLEDSEPYTYALHHKDETLKYVDPVRYNEWRPEDLEVMPFGKHSSHHAKKQKQSEESNRKRSEALKGRKISAEVREHMRQASLLREAKKRELKNRCA